MSVQLLDKTRKIGKLLHNNNSNKVVFNDICLVLSEILSSNVLVISCLLYTSFAIERYRQKMMFTNPLLREVKTFYKEEYLVGEYAIALIERRIGISLPVDEAASIALHIVNAE